MSEMADELADAWRALVTRLGRATPEAYDVGADLLRRYAEPQRRYHDQRHLAEVLAGVDRLAARAPDSVVDEARLAAWFHDAVYDPQAAPGANEEASATLAEAALLRLDLDPALVRRVAALVRATTDHDPSGGEADPARDLLFDADLAILAAAATRYAEYTGAVRQEYAHVPDELFGPARAAILQGFLDRPRIYRSEAACAAWESAARANLAAEVTRLTT